MNSMQEKIKSLIRKVKCCMPVLCLAVLVLSCTNEEKNTIVCWGDSLTMQHKDYGIRGNIEKWLSGNFIDDSYPGFLEEMIGDEYNIVNCGIGGENTLTIAARQGSIPMFLDKNVVFKEGVDEVNIENDILRSSWDSTAVAPLHYGRWEEGRPARINPCNIAGNEFFLKCESIENGDSTVFKYTLKREGDTDKRLIVKKGSMFVTEASKHLRKPFVNIFFIGQNGGFKDIPDYVAQLKRMIEFGKSSRYIVISFHKPNNIINNVEEMKAMEDSLTSVFGKHYINLRDYMVSKGVTDALMTATEEDVDSIKKGQVPPQLLTDGTHFNASACRLIALLVKSKMKELGY